MQPLQHHLNRGIKIKVIIEITPELFFRSRRMKKSFKEIADTNKHEELENPRVHALYNHGIG